MKFKKNYYFKRKEFTSLLSKKSLEAGRFGPEYWVSFHQKNFLQKTYYCIDETGKNSNALDGLADIVEIGRNRFIRERDYKLNKPVFHKADQYIATTKSRLENESSENIN